MTGTRTQVVVTGLGVACAPAGDVPSFESALRIGRTGIGPLPPDERVADVEHAALLVGFSLDAVLSGLPLPLPEPVRQRARRATRMSGRPVQVAVAVAAQAWLDAQLAVAPVPGDRIGLVIAGHNLSDRVAERLWSAGQDQVRPRYALQYQDTDHVGTVSQVLGITGEGCTVGGASASGGVGLITGARLVAWGVVDVCLVVGALVEPSRMALRALRAVGAMAGGEEACPPSPFDVTHRGFVYGQGSGCVVLESATSAVARGVLTKAVVAGWSAALDANNLANPDRDGQVRAMTGALRMAGAGPDDVSYVNTHGTGSPLGDETELMAVRAALGAAAERPWINATKGLTGHCLGAAGVVEAVATVLQIGCGFVHPNVGLSEPVDPGLRFAGPVAERYDGGLALSNSFGFGGFNTCVAFAPPW